MSQKSFVSKRSSFNRIHTRSLFNHIQKETKFLLRNYVLTHNTLTSRQNIATALKLYLEKIKINKGIYSAYIYVEPFENGVLITIIIKPAFVTERVTLKMFNSGSNEFKSIIS